MTVCKIEDETITQVWDDVETLGEFLAKYGLSGSEYEEVSAVPGQIRSGGRFRNPILIPITVAERAVRATAAADVDMATPLMRALTDTLLSDEADLFRFRTALETRHRALG